MPRTREEAIRIINDTYPPDSEWEDTNKIGRELLYQAKMETMDWRDTLPDATIFRYAELCEDRERNNR